MPYRKPFLKILGVSTELTIMAMIWNLALATAVSLSGVYQSFGWAADVFFAFVAAEYVIGWLAHKRRGDWCRKEATGGVIVIGVMVIILLLVKLLCVKADVKSPYESWIACFWAANAFRGLYQNAVYLGVPPIPGLRETVDWGMSKLSRLLVPVEKLVEDEARERAEMARKIAIARRLPGDEAAADGINRPL